MERHPLISIKNNQEKHFGFGVQIGPTTVITCKHVHEKAGKPNTIRLPDVEDGVRVTAHLDKDVDVCVYLTGYDEVAETFYLKYVAPRATLTLLTRLDGEDEKFTLTREDKSHITTAGDAHIACTITPSPNTPESGMSGSPIYDDDDYLVGLHAAYNGSGVKPTTDMIYIGQILAFMETLLPDKPYLWHYFKFQKFAHIEAFYTQEQMLNGPSPSTPVCRRSRNVANDIPIPKVFQSLIEKETLNAYEYDILQHVASQLKKKSYLPVPRVLGFETEDNGKHHIYTQDLGELNLHQWIEKGDYTWDDACNVISAIFDALELLHKANVIHCDLHPGNILLQQKEEGGFRAFFCDLEHAAVISGELRSTTSSSTRKPVTDRFYATAYADSGDVSLITAREDIYSLAWVLLQILLQQNLKNAKTLTEFNLPNQGLNDLFDHIERSETVKHLSELREAFTAIKIQNLPIRQDPVTLVFLIDGSIQNTPEQCEKLKSKVGEIIEGVREERNVSISIYTTNFNPLVERISHHRTIIWYNPFCLCKRLSQVDSLESTQWSKCLTEANKKYPDAQIVGIAARNPNINMTNCRTIGLNSIPRTITTTIEYIVQQEGV